MLEVGILYDWSSMTVTVRGLALYAAVRRGILDKFLGLVVTSVHWPTPPRGQPAAVLYRLDNKN